MKWVFPGAYQAGNSSAFALFTPLGSLDERRVRFPSAWRGGLRYGNDRIEPPLMDLAGPIADKGIQAVPFLVGKLTPKADDLTVITAVDPFRWSGEWICGRPSLEWRPNRALYARNRALVYNAADRIRLDDAELRYDTQLRADRSLFFVATGAVRQLGDDRRWKHTPVSIHVAPRRIERHQSPEDLPVGC